MLCANCDNKGVFTTMTAIGEKAFCCEKCYAEYVGLPVEKEGYYGFMAESFEAEHKIIKEESEKILIQMTDDEATIDNAEEIIDFLVELHRWDYESDEEEKELFIYFQDEEGKKLRSLNYVVRGNKVNDAIIDWFSDYDYPIGGYTAETFEASVVHKGKQPKGAIGKAMMNRAMIERAEIESMIQELENKVQLGIISEDDLMKSLTQRFGAEFEVIDWNNLHDKNRELFVQKLQEYYDDFKENNPELHKEFEERIMNEESWYGYERGKSYAETKEKWTKKLSDLGYEYERIDDYWEYIGYDNTPLYEHCNYCDGEGVIITKYYPATREDPADADYVDCEMCEGKGKVLEEMNAEYEDCQVCFTTVEKGGLNDVQAGLICDTCYDMNKYAGGTGRENNRPYSAETLSKTSCCCGATESNPCACMKAPEPMNCSATEPKCQCYKDLEKNAEETEMDRAKIILDNIIKDVWREFNMGSRWRYTKEDWLDAKVLENDGTPTGWLQTPQRKEYYKKSYPIRDSDLPYEEYEDDNDVGYTWSPTELAFEMVENYQDKLRKRYENPSIKLELEEEAWNPSARLYMKISIGKETMEKNAEFLYYYVLNEKGESPADFNTLEEAQTYVANSSEPLEIYERRSRDDEAYKMDKKMNAETFEAEEGDDCPNCYCEHQNLSLYGTPYVDEEYVSVNVVCDDCGMKGNTTTYPYEWDNEAKLEDVGLPLAVNMYNPNYGELRCSRCLERFEKSAENYVLDVE